jgi:hypothetical protein
MTEIKTPYCFGKTLGELDAGIFLDKVSRAMLDVAGSVILTHRAGKVVIELTMAQIGETAQIELKHKLTFHKPTLRGKASEEEQTSTSAWVGKRGLSLMPDTQTSLDFTTKRN